MTVAFVLDFPGATKDHYDQVVERMHLDGHRMAPGGLVHVAGSYDGGWRVIDIWRDAGQFARFSEEQIVPHTQAVGMGPPTVRMIELEEEIPGNGEPSAFVQCVTLLGLDRASFHAADEAIRPDGEVPEAITFHYRGPVESGWFVIDGWTSKDARDAFMESRIRPVMQDAPLQGPPQIEELMVEATLIEGAPAPM
jgi:hypothetical protein